MRNSKLLKDYFLLVANLIYGETKQWGSVEYFLNAICFIYCNLKVKERYSQYRRLWNSLFPGFYNFCNVVCTTMLTEWILYLFIYLFYEYLPRIVSSVLTRLLSMSPAFVAKHLQRKHMAISSERLSSTLWPVKDSNHWPAGFESNALTTWPQLHGL